MAIVSEGFDYKENFDSSWYMRTYYSDTAGCIEEGDFLCFILNSLHDIFESGEITGKTLLDIGTGPTIHSVISAAPRVESIYLSDYAKPNRDVLNRWLEGKEENVPELCQYVTKLEKSNQTVSERSAEIRGKTKAVLDIDVKKWPLIEADDKPDVITSSLCLEAACLNLEEYQTAVKNLCRLLHSGGHLVLVGVLDETFYKVGDFNIPVFKINENDLKKVYRDNGFEIKKWFEYDHSTVTKEEAEFSDFHKAFVMHAVKK